MKIINYCLVSSVLLFIGGYLVYFLGIFSHGLWRTYEVDLVSAFLILLCIFIFNKIVIRFFITDIGLTQKIFISVVVISFNYLAISNIMYIHDTRGS